MSKLVKKKIILIIYEIMENSHLIIYDRTTKIYTRQNIVLKTIKMKLTLFPEKIEPTFQEFSTFFIRRH